MARKGIFLFAFCLIFALNVEGSVYKDNAQSVSLVTQKLENYSVAPRFSSAEICTVRHDADAYWAISHWITGEELYKSYQDPALSCIGPYPFTVQYIYMVLIFETPCTLYISVDVETADLTDPNCPFPGELVSISSTYSVAIPSSGMYQIEVPLDSAAIVNEPYFVGFYFANAVDSAWGASLVTDSIPTPCVAYNIWDTTIGYVDLDSTGFPSFPQFPGRLLLYSAGMPGGGGGEQPEPSITLLRPEYNEKISGDVVIWAVETSGSDIIDYVKFDYMVDDVWHEIVQDYDGSSPLRNGVDPSGTGEGFAAHWDYSALTEGPCWLKATAYDTLGRFDADSLQVSVDPTPPNPVLINPEPMDTVCLPITLEAHTDDENINLVKFEKKAASINYQASVITLNQFQYGDNNGNPADGNYAASGEYGDYYCGPVAGAIAVKYWFDKGFIYCMREGSQYISVDTVVERLAENMQTRSNNGTYDDLFYNGLQRYIVTHGNELRLNVYRNPDYHQFRTLLEERELLLVLGLSGSPGLYLVGAGVSGMADSLGQYTIKASDPLTGTIIDLLLRNNTGGSEIFYDGSWHSLDIIITVMGYSHAVSRDYIGADNSSAGGWTFDWSSSDMLEDSLYFISVTASDATSRTDISTSLIQYICDLIYLKGDYNGDDAVTIGDGLYLIEFIYKGGDPPVGGAGRADANCDGNIDISDVIFIIKYILAGGEEPCY